MDRTSLQTLASRDVMPVPSGTLQRRCACGNHTSGGECSGCKEKKQSLQTKLRVSKPGDKYEEEADRIADHVVGVQSSHTPAQLGSPSQLQRAGYGAEELQAGAFEQAQQVLASGGEPLPRETRSYFEPRFGHDFSAVRIHSDARAADASAAIHARGYTIGQNIAFASGEFNPASSQGRHLIAHELAHVVQQRGQSPAVQRNVAATSSCPASVHSAPADPITELTADDARAQHIALGTSNVLVLEALTFADPIFGPSYVSDAYARRFGPPPGAVRGRFRNRFTGRTYPTEDDAKREEMLSLSDRYRTLHTFLSGPIRYRCPGTSKFTLPGCAESTCGGAIAKSCPGSRQIAICPTFWTYPLMQTADQRGCNMIHEAVHMRLNLNNHDKGNADQRGRDSECYAAMAADIYGFQTDDSLDCTPLIP